jgi:hypothetical protein
MDRYIIFDDSMVGTWEFGCSVLDTTNPTVYNGEHYKDSLGRYHYESICECHSEDEAKLICDALNFYNKNKE